RGLRRVLPPVGLDLLHLDEPPEDDRGCLLAAADLGAESPGLLVGVPVLVVVSLDERDGPEIRDVDAVVGAAGGAVAGKPWIGDLPRAHPGEDTSLEGSEYPLGDIGIDVALG